MIVSLSGPPRLHSRPPAPCRSWLHRDCQARRLRVSKLQCPARDAVGAEYQNGSFIIPLARQGRLRIGDSEPCKLPVIRESFPGPVGCAASGGPL